MKIIRGDTPVLQRISIRQGEFEWYVHEYREYADGEGRFVQLGRFDQKSDAYIFLHAVKQARAEGRY